MITPVQLIRRFREKRAFTLAEVIIASSIFVIVSLIGVTIFVNVMRIQRRITLENAIYEDGRFMMERIAREIRQNTIDYEEYYRAARGGKKHGEDFGCYAQSFYHPGVHTWSGTGLGAECSVPAGGDPVLNPGCIINKNSLDINTGQNPYNGLVGYSSIDANALCDEPNIGDTNCALGQADVSLRQDQLFLINSAGDQKTYIGRKLVNSGTGENAVSMVRLSGEDTDTDGITEKWYDAANKYRDYCNNGYNCPTTLDDLDDNLDGSDGEPLYNGFVPLTPLRTDITNLNFYVSPAEDPRKAFAETAPAEGIQQQQHVTVVMSLQPAVSELEGFGGNPPEITLQTTITSRTYNEVKSYLGANACT